MGLRGSITVVKITGADQVLLSPSEKRYAVLFQSSPGNTGTIAINNRILVAADDGAIIASGPLGYPLCAREFGDLVKGPWHAFGSVAGDFVTVIEGLEI